MECIQQPLPPFFRMGRTFVHDLEIQDCILCNTFSKKFGLLHFLRYFTDLPIMNTVCSRLFILHYFLKKFVICDCVGEKIRKMRDTLGSSTVYLYYYYYL